MIFKFQKRVNRLHALAGAAIAAMYNLYIQFRANAVITAVIWKVVSMKADLLLLKVYKSTIAVNQEAGGPG